jgi:hypothetical protein
VYNNIEFQAKFNRIHAKDWTPDTVTDTAYDIRYSYRCTLQEEAQPSYNRVNGLQDTK